MAARTEQTNHQHIKKTLKFKDGSTLEDRVARILSEILSDKYDCKVTIRFIDHPDEEHDQKVEEIR